MTRKPQDAAGLEQKLKAAFAADRTMWQQDLRRDLRAILIRLSCRNHPPKDEDVLAQMLNVFSVGCDPDLRDLVTKFAHALPYDLNRRRRQNMQVWEQLQRNQEQRRRDAEKPEADE